MEASHRGSAECDVAECHLVNQKLDNAFNLCRVHNPNQFSAEFASSVTAASSPKKTDWIAKNGRESLFALLQDIFPLVGGACLMHRTNAVA
jgi:hypothetical protein